MPDAAMMTAAAMPTVNWWVVLVCAIASMVVGMIWYGPLFGKKYMHLIGVDPKKMKKGGEGCGMSMFWCYLGQFLLSAVQAYVLISVTIMGEAFFHTGFMESALMSAFWLWLGFSVPFNGGAAIWSNHTTRDKWASFWIGAGGSLVTMMVFAWIIGAWQ